MQLRGGSVAAYGNVAVYRKCVFSARRHHHGYSKAADDLWNVQQSGKSNGCVRDRRGTGRTDSNAVRACLSRSMGARFTDSNCMRKAYVEQFIKMYVCLWRGNINKYDAGNDGADTVTGNMRHEEMVL